MTDNKMKTFFSDAGLTAHSRDCNESLDRLSLSFKQVSEKSEWFLPGIECSEFDTASVVEDTSSDVCGPYATKTPTFLVNSKNVDQSIGLTSLSTPGATSENVRSLLLDVFTVSEITSYYIHSVDFSLEGIDVDSELLSFLEDTRVVDDILKDSTVSFTKKMILCRSEMLEPNFLAKYRFSYYYDAVKHDPVDLMTCYFDVVVKHNQGDPELVDRAIHLISEFDLRTNKGNWDKLSDEDSDFLLCFGGAYPDSLQFLLVSRELIFPHSSNTSTMLPYTVFAMILSIIGWESFVRWRAVRAIRDNVVVSEDFSEDLFKCLPKELCFFFTFLRSIKSMGDSFARIDLKKMLTMFISLASVLRAENFVDMSLAFSIFLLNVPSQILLYVKDFVFRSQAEDDYKRNIFQKAAAVITCVLTSDIFKEASGVPLWLGEVVLKWLSTANSCGSIAMMFVDLFKSVLRCYDNYNKTGSLYSLFGINEYERLRDLMSQTNIEISGFSVTKECTKVDLLKIEERIRHFDKMSPAMSKLYTTYTYDLIQLKENFDNFKRNGVLNRQQPLGMLFFGSPGTGKSCMLNVIERMTKARYQLPDDLNITLHLANTKHQTLPSMPLIAVWNDCFATKDEHCTDPTLCMIQTLLDTAPLKLETASLSEKAKSHIAPEFVLLSTNSYNYTFTKTKGGANKLDRRLLTTEMKYSQKTLNEVKERIVDDPSFTAAKYIQSLEPNSLEFDESVDFIVREMNTVLENTINFDKGSVKYRTSSRRQYYLYFEKLRLQHVDRNSKVAKVEYCKHGLPKTQIECDCEVVLSQQGLYNWVLEGGDDLILSLGSSLSTVEVSQICSYQSFREEEKDKFVIDLTKYVCLLLKLKDATYFKHAESIHSFLESYIQREILEKSLFGEIQFEVSKVVYLLARDFGYFSSKMVEVLESVNYYNLYYEKFQHSSEYPHERISALVAIRKTLNISLDLGLTRDELCYLGKSRPTTPEYKAVIDHYHDVAVWQSHHDENGNEFFIYKEVTVLSGGRMRQLMQMIETRLNFGILSVSTNTEGKMDNGGYFMANAWRTYANVTICLVSVKLASQFFRSFLNMFKAYEVINEQASLKEPISGVTNSYVVKSFKNFSSSVQPWIGQVAAKACPGIVELRMSTENRPNYRIHALVVANNVLLLNHHAFHDIQYSSLSKGVSPETPFDVVINNVSVRAYFNPSCYVQLSKDIGLYFVNLSNVMTTALNKITRERKTGNMNGVILGEHVSVNLDANSKYICRVGKTAPGDCGNPLWLNDEIIGIVAAGQTGVVTLCEPVDQQMISRGFEMLRNKGFCPMELDTSTSKVDLSGFKDVDAIVAHGRADVAWILKENNECQIRSGFQVLAMDTNFSREKMSCQETPYHKVFGGLCGSFSAPLTGHAVLVDGVWKSPTTSRLQLDRVFNLPHFDMFVNIAKEEAFRFKSSVVLPHSLSPTNLYTALLGDPDNCYFGPTDIDKSVGMLHAINGRTRHQVFRIVDGVHEVHPSVEQRYRELEEALLSDRIPFHYCKGTTKDECLPTEKVVKGKRRMFEVLEKEVNLLLKAYLRPLTSLMISNPKVCGIFSTMDAGGKDWDEYARFLIGDGRPENCNYLGQDLSDCDVRQGAMKEVIGVYFYELAKHYGYSERDARMTAKLVSFVFKRIVVIEGVWYLSEGSLPSGCDITGIYNGLFVVFSWLGYCRLKGVPRESTRPSANGDDGLHVVDLEFVRKDLLTDYKSYMSDLGAKVTGEGKGDDVEFLPLTQVTFLKRRFRFDEGVWKGPLALKSLYKSLSYCTGKFSEQEMKTRMENTVLCCLKEMYLHGREVFTNFVDLCIQNNIPVKFTYDKLDTMYLRDTLLIWKTEDFVGEEQDLFLMEAFGDTGKELNPSTSTPLTSVSETTVEFVGATFQKEELSSGSTFKMPTEDDSQVSEILARPVMIADGVLSIGNTFIGNVNTKWRAVSKVSSITSGYRHFGGDAVLTFSVAAGAGVCGLVRFSFRPYVQASDYDSGNFSYASPDEAAYTQSSLFPNVTINLAEVTEYSLRLPHPFPTRFASGPEDWDMQVDVYGLYSVYGITLPDIPFQVYCHYENIRFMGLVAQGGEMSENMLSRSLSYVKMIAASVPHPYASILSRLSGTASDIALKMGYGRPMAEPVQAVVVRNHTNTALTSGQDDLLFHLGVDPGVASNTAWNQYPLGESTDMDLKHQLRRWSQIAMNQQATWYSSVFPTMVSGVDGGGIFYPTSLGYFSAMFDKWRGSIEMKIVFRGSSLVRSKVRIGIFPPGVTPTGSYPNGSFLSHVIDVCGSVEHVFSVPFLTYQTWANIISFAAAGSFHSQSTRVQVIYLMDAIGPVAETQQPPFDLYIRAGEDFDLALPSTERMNLYLSPQGGHEAFSFGENNSLGSLAKRSCLLMELETTTSGPFSVQLAPDAYDPTPTAVIGTTFQYNYVGWTFDLWIRLAYIGYNGGSAWRINSNNIPSPGHRFLMVPLAYDYGRPSYDYWLKNSGSGMAFIVAASGNITEVGCPSRNSQGWKASRVSVGTQLGYCLVMVPSYKVLSVPAAGISVSFSHCAMEDRTFGGFLGPPPLKLR